MYEAKINYMSIVISFRSICSLSWHSKKLD